MHCNQKCHFVHVCNYCMVSMWLKCFLSLNDFLLLHFCRLWQEWKTVLIKPHYLTMFLTTIPTEAQNWEKLMKQMMNHKVAVPASLILMQCQYCYCCYFKVDFKVHMKKKLTIFFLNRNFSSWSQEENWCNLS